MKITKVFVFSLFLTALSVWAQKNIPYTEAGNSAQTLDLYLPANVKSPTPLIIWIHGGGWKNGSKENCLPLRLGFTARGYAVASINYRLTGEAAFPSQIQDCKAAVRWLRAHAGEYNLNPDRFGAWGSSAGGHLVALLGTSSDIAAFDTGENLKVSSRVQAVCDYYGPSDFTAEDAGPDIKLHSSEDSPEAALLGGTPDKKPEVAKAASPVTHATPDDPPFLIVHGDQDRTVWLDQSCRMDSALRMAGVETELIILPGSGHGGPAFASKETINKVSAFFDRHLKQP